MKNVLPHLNTALAALIILILSLGESGTSISRNFVNIPFADKIVHFIMYFILTGVVLFQYRKRIASVNILIFICLTIFFYGILLELLQKYLTDTRHFEVKDIIFNFGGIITALVIYFFLLKHKK
jgi:VanZ family protein